MSLVCGCSVQAAKAEGQINLRFSLIICRHLMLVGEQKTRQIAQKAAR